ncbi:hypothetical protein [Humidesulfovibrio sp.]
MNQTQINYFTRRMDSLVNIITRNMREALPLKDKLSPPEKAGLIASGKATFREELFTGPDCRNSPYLFDCFDFPGEDDIKGFNAMQYALIVKTEEKIKKEAAKLVDAFVLEKIEADEALAKLEKMKFWKEV